MKIKIQMWLIAVLALVFMGCSSESMRSVSQNTTNSSGPTDQGSPLPDDPTNTGNNNDSESDQNEDPTQEVQPLTGPTDLQSAKLTIDSQLSVDDKVSKLNVIDEDESLSTLLVLENGQGSDDNHYFYISGRFLHLAKPLDPQQTQYNIRIEVRNGDYRLDKELSYSYLPPQGGDSGNEDPPQDGDSDEQPDPDSGNTDCNGYVHDIVDFDFEDGKIPKVKKTTMKIDPEILVENGNHFLRIQGHIDDKDNIPDRYPEKSRSTMTMTELRMPRLEDANRAQHYSAIIRAGRDRNDRGSSAIFELFQRGQSLGDYGTNDSSGPVARFLLEDNRIYFTANYESGTQQDEIDFGRWDPNQWYLLEIKAVWSHDPNEGVIEAYINGERKARITGRGTNLGPNANVLPRAKFGMYGSYSTGVFDIDDVLIQPWIEKLNCD